MFKKTFSFAVLFIFMINTSSANDGIKSVLQDYQFAVTVEWDQKDPAFLKAQEEKLLSSVETLMLNGHSPRELIQESLSLIPDERQRAEVEQSMAHFEKGEISKEDISNLLKQHSGHMSQAGATWSPVAYVLIGVVVTYAAFKLLILSVYYFDNDWHNSDQPEIPPAEPKP